MNAPLSRSPAWWVAFGKIGVPDEVLGKAGCLSVAERCLVERGVKIAAQLLP